MTTCLREGCTQPTVYGSPACAGHWQVWRDEDQERIAVEWDLDMVASEYEAELNERRERHGRSAS